MDETSVFASTLIEELTVLPPLTKAIACRVFAHAAVFCLAGLCIPAHAQVSPEIHPDRRVTLRLKAPKADKVLVLGDWLKRGEQLSMVKGVDGVWSVSAGPFEPGNYIYGFEVDGLQMPDPSNASVKLRAARSGSYFHVPGDAIWEARDVPHGNVEINVHDSKLLGDTRWLSVYTPPHYHRDTEQKYPVLYLLHGSNDTAIGWVMIGSANLIMDNLIADKACREMIVVMPNGHALPYGSPRGSRPSNTEQFTAYLLKEVVPLVERKYRVRSAKQGRAIAGLSMGGGQAVTIGMQNRDKFSSVASFSGSLPSRDAEWLAPVLNESEAINEDLDLLWIGCGRDDFLLDRNKAFVEKLKEHDVDHTFQLSEGVHNYAVWRRHLATVVPQLFPSLALEPGATGNAANVKFIGKSDPEGNPVRLAKRTGHVSNYDEQRIPDYKLPDPLTMDGKPITSPREWALKRERILQFYRDQIYGRVPKNAPTVVWKVLESEEGARKGAATTKVIEGTFHSVGEHRAERKVKLTLHLPQRAEPGDRAPVLLHLSFFGGEFPRRGKGPSFDPVAEVLSHGWAYARIGYNEIQRDRPDQWQDGVIGMTLAEGQTRPAPDQWGTISAWAWGVSRIIDYLETDESIDPKRISLTGASRLGKTSLWAAAQDERISSIFAVVPGEMGASLIRRDWGETLDDMAQNFHYQFAGNLQHWVGRWNDLPVDQHMLIAAIAPRPVYINGGLHDQWSDPKGEFLAMAAASPVYELLGVKGLGAEKVPPLDQLLAKGRLAFYYHSEGHRAVDEDWTQFLEFADSNAAKEE